MSAAALTATVTVLTARACRSARRVLVGRCPETTGDGSVSHSGGLSGLD